MWDVLLYAVTMCCFYWLSPLCLCRHQHLLFFSPPQPLIQTSLMTREVKHFSSSLLVICIYPITFFTVYSHYFCRMRLHHPSFVLIFICPDCYEYFQPPSIHETSQQFLKLLLWLSQLVLTCPVKHLQNCYCFLLFNTGSLFFIMKPSEIFHRARMVSEYN